MLAVIVQLERVGDGMLHVHYCYIGIFSSVGLCDVVLTHVQKFRFLTFHLRIGARSAETRAICSCCLHDAVVVVLSNCSQLAEGFVGDLSYIGIVFTIVSCPLTDVDMH